MVGTPDRRAGPLFEEEIIFDDYTGVADPEDVRTMRYRDGFFRFTDALGAFDPATILPVTFGARTRVSTSGVLSFEHFSGITTTTVPWHVPFNAKLLYASLATNRSDNNQDYKLSIRKGTTTEVASVAFPSGSTFADGTFNVDFVPADDVVVGLVQTAGPSQKSQFRYSVGTLVFRVQL